MRFTRSFAAAALGALALASASGSAPAQPAAPAPSAAPQANPAPQAPAADLDAKPLEADPPGPDKTKSPKADAWTKASHVRLTRLSPAAAGCVASRVDEWLRVRCPVKTFAVSLLGGPTDGLAFWIGPEAEGQPGEVQFPLRRGDRRVVQFWTYGKDAEGNFAAKPALVVQEQWVEGEAAPTVTVL